MTTTTTLETIQGKGFSVDSTMTDDEAATILRSLDSGFARSLAEQHDAGRVWSESQRAWAHRLANEHSGDASAIHVGDRVTDHSPELFAMFRRATASLKRPRLTFVVGDTEMTLTQAGPDSRNAGYLYVKGGNDYWGKISPRGDFSPARDCPADAVSLLRRLLADPVAAVSDYGRRTGDCCCCHRELTDERSLLVGYGPVCATRWGLPWGERPKNDVTQ